jgi:arsenate reductase-like glutaredoxin family protein
MEQLVLKGGNALALVHGIGGRTSVDLDYSLGSDFEDIAATSDILKSCLEAEFRRHSLVVFDFECSAKPSTPRSGTPAWWGGYLVTFKLLDRASYDAAKNLDDARWRALESSAGSGAKRTFKIDISKHEYTAPKMATEVQDFTVHVYTLEMIAAEKLRAICQQMSGYELISEKMKRARARDFYDIHAIVTGKAIDLAAEENMSLIREMFRAKQVPLQFLARISDESTLAFHEPGWASVRASARPDHEFRHYFDFVASAVAELKSLWEVDPPG